jgi:hypothetical protein
MKTSDWKQIPPIPGFSCLRMKAQAQAKIAKETRGMSPERVLEYFREASKSFAASFEGAYPVSARSEALAAREAGGEPVYSSHVKSQTRKRRNVEGR